ncbi:hypothetical protein ACGYQ5_14365 [Burkholderia pseudomallei]
MSEDRAGGLCAAHGCPLLGSLGRAGQWVCFCHANADSAVWQEITRVIRANEAIAASTLDIRRFRFSENWATAYRGIAKRLREADRADLLPSASSDGSPHRENPSAIVTQWLTRLERELLQAVANIKPNDGPMYGFATIPTAPVPTPTRAIEHVPRYYRDSEGGEQ